MIFYLFYVIFLLISIYSFVYTSTADIVKFVDTNLNGFTNFLYLNDKSAFAVSFTFFLIVLYTYKTESNIKEFGNNIFIIYFHRIGYDFYCFIEIMIYLIYSILGLNYSLTGQNLSFITVGIIFYIMIYSTVSNLLVYIPVKLCLSTFLHQNSANKV